MILGRAVLAVEVVLNSYVIVSWKLKTPLSRRDFIRLMNHLVENTPIADIIIAFKKKHSFHDPEKDLLGKGWYAGYQTTCRCTKTATRIL